VIALSLPYPPSANHLWTNAGKKQILTDKYRQWKSLAWSAIVDQRAGRLFKNTVPGHFSLMLLADRPDRRRRDISNTLKATEDALVTAGVIEDDHLAERITLAWSKRAPGKGAKVHITIEAAQ